MGTISNFFKGVMAPALIALTLYLLLHYVVVPLYRRHANRYSQYLPVQTQNPLASLTSSTSGLRGRLSSTALSWLLPSRWAEWRYAHRRNERVQDANDAGDGLSDEELGEDIDFDLEANDEREQRRRRDGLSLSIDARGRDSNSDRRLSRELEEGFADSSDEEDDLHVPRR